MHLELNGPASLLTIIMQARDALRKQQFLDLDDCLKDAESQANLMVEWFQLLQQAETEVPISWTEFIHTRSKSTGQTRHS